MKRHTQRGSGSDVDGQFQIDWNDAKPPASVEPITDKPRITSAGRDPALVQRLKWDFRTTFPQPMPEALEAGILSDEDAEPENIRALHGEQIREGLVALRSLDAVLDARRRGVDPATGKKPATAAAQERVDKLLTTEPARLERLWQTLMDTYEEAFGPDAADAFGKALRAWDAGVEVVAEDARPLQPKAPDLADTPLIQQSITRPARIVGRLPVPRPLPAAVAAGNFGRDERGRPIRPCAQEVREITEQHAEKLIGLLDGDNRSVPDAQRWQVQEGFRNALASYAEDFGQRAGEQLEAYVRRQVGLDVGSRRGR